MGARVAVASLLVVMAIVVAACGSGEDGSSADPPERDAEPPPSETAPPAGEAAPSEAETVPPEPETAPPEAEPPAPDTIAVANDGSLPERPGPRTMATPTVPHIQLLVDPVPEVDAELRRRAFMLPDVEDRESGISLPGARALWLPEDLPLERPDVLLRGEREFAHFHPDGSLHALLPIDRAREVHETKWGEIHPWAEMEDVWGGLVMLYSPLTPEELEVTLQLIVDSYTFVTGQDVDPATLN